MPAMPNSVRLLVNWFKRFGFRFTVLYFLLFTFPFPIGSLAPGLILNEDWPWNRLWQKLAPWIGHHVLRHPDAYTARSFSLLDSDSWLQWIQVGCFLTLALLGSFVWAFFDIERRKDPRIREALRYVLRYVLVAAMFSYGMEKVLLLQMPAPRLNELRAHYGDFSPFTVLWFFVGYSPVYQFFSGAVEVLAGLFLLFRRTATLGALVTAAVMTNVAMMNLCYDVPVKINSLHFLLMAVILVMDDGRRLLNLFVFNRPTEPRTTVRFWPEGWKTTLACFAHALVLLWIFGAVSAGMAALWKSIRSSGSPHPMAGVYEVETFKRDGREVPPTLTDATRWREFQVGDNGKVTILNMPDKRIFKAPAESVHYQALGAASGHLSITPDGKTGDMPSQSIELTCTFMEPNKLRVEGEVAGQQLSIILHRVMPEDFPLMKAKFSWVRKWP